MQGTEKQIAYAAKVQGSVVQDWRAAAARLEAAIAAGLEPAAVPIVQDLAAHCRSVADQVEAGEDAAFILDHHHTTPAQWRTVMQHGDWNQRLKDALGRRDAAEMGVALSQIIANGGVLL